MTKENTAAPTIESVRKSITVRVPQQRAFEAFTAEIDSWWPRRHHIGSGAMQRVVLEGRVRGRCYSEQDDGTVADFGTVLAWDPPRRFVMAWQVTTGWKFEPDLARSSEVEVIFTPLGGDETRVDLEHRHFERYGPSGAAMREAVGSPGGWGESLQRFAEQAEGMGPPNATGAESAGVVRR